MKKRASLYIFLATLAGTFFSVKLALSFIMLFLVGVSAFIMTLLGQNPVLKIVTFLLMVSSITGISLKYAMSNYDELLSRMPPDERVYVASVKDVVSRLDGSKKLMLVAHEAHDSKTVWNIVLTLYDAAAALPIDAPASICFRAKLKPMQKALSHVHFNDYGYGLGKNIHGRVTINEANFISLTKKEHEDFLTNFRQHLRKQLLKILSPHQASLLLAMILGETSLFEEEQSRVYQNIGAKHLLAVSGLQVGLIGLLCFFLLLFLFSLSLPFCPSRLPHLAAALFSLVLVWLFVALCHWPRSGIRAALMLSILLGSKAFTRPVDIFDAFLNSGFLSLLYDPLSIFDHGFLLSYASVFGLIMVEKYDSQRSSWLLSTAIKLLISSTAAFLATLPIILYFYQNLAPAGLLANFILVPIASLLQIPTILGGIFGVLLNLDWLIHLAAFFASCLEIITEAIEKVLGTIFFVPHFSPQALALAALGLFIIFIALLYRKPHSIALGLILLALPALELQAHLSEELNVSVLAVGQGDASIFSLASGHQLLIDTGGQAYGHFDLSKTIVLNSLKRRGIKNLDVLIISHPDPDHILGAFSVLDEVNVKEIWHSGFHAEHPLTKKLLAMAAAKNIPVKDSHKILGAHHFGETVIEVLAPKSRGPLPYYPELSSNNNSLVIKISYQGQSLLWPGDLEALGEQLLLKSAAKLDSTVLKAPHHGSKTSSSLAFIEAVNPQHVIYSTGVNNRFFFPHSEVVARYNNKKITSYNTAVNGEINIKISKGQITFAPYIK